MNTIRELDLLLQEMGVKQIPKEKEKKQHGEVFTPLIVVEDMLNRLDEAYQYTLYKLIYVVCKRRDQDKDCRKHHNLSIDLGEFFIVVKGIETIYQKQSHRYFYHKRKGRKQGRPSHEESDHKSQIIQKTNHA